MTTLLSNMRFKLMLLSLLEGLCSLSSAQETYFQPNSTGIRYQNGFERVFIQPFGLHGIRIRTSIMRDPTGSELSFFVDPPIEGPGGNTGLQHDTTIILGDNNDFASLRNGNIIVQLDSGQLSFHRVEANGSITLLTSEYKDTKALPPRYYTQDFRSSSFEAMFSFTSEPEEQIYGVGQQACCKDAVINKKGYTVDLMNFNSHVPMPIYMSNKGYMQVFNYPGEGRLEFGPLRTRLIAKEATVIDYWITTAEPGDFDALQRSYTGITGRQPTPPDFMLGYQQSKLRYANQTQIIDLAQRFHEEGVNVSLIVIDFFAWKFQGDWSFNETAWPNPAEMAAQVKQLTGAELMVSSWVSVESASVNYPALQDQGLLATTRDGTGIVDSFNGAYIRLIDPTNPEARAFFWKRLNDSYFSKGIHNFWLDIDEGNSLGEPIPNVGEPANTNQIPYSRPFTQYHSGTQEASGKAFPFFHQQAIDELFQNLTSSAPNATSCPFMSLSRSTFIGGQRHCSYVWSGDTTSEFTTLSEQITAGVSMAASGIGSWTLDTGGFSGLDINSTLGKELYVRWFGMSVFLPYLRTHGQRQCSGVPPDPSGDQTDSCPNEPWSYGEENLEILKKYIALRYSLVPYYKRLFELLQSKGQAIMRPLYFDFSLSDRRVVEGTSRNDPQIIFQFMSGPRILVAPVFIEGATQRTVYLPSLTNQMLDEGFKWKYWWNDTDFGTGGKAVTIGAPLGMIPVFYLGEKEDILAGNV